MPASAPTTVHTGRSSSICFAHSRTVRPNIALMNEERQLPADEATNRDGLASLAIILLAIVLVAFAISQIVS